VHYSGIDAPFTDGVVLVGEVEVLVDEGTRGQAFAKEIDEARPEFGQTESEDAHRQDGSAQIRRAPGGGQRVDGGQDGPRLPDEPLTGRGDGDPPVRSNRRAPTSRSRR
jgi:hypothetical protein